MRQKDPSDHISLEKETLGPLILNLNLLHRGGDAGKHI